MEIRFYDAKSKEIVWTGDLGFPVPRVGESMFFIDEEAGWKPFESPAAVVHVHYFVQPGTGNSRVDVFLMMQPKQTPTERAKSAGLVIPS